MQPKTLTELKEIKTSRFDPIETLDSSRRTTFNTYLHLVDKFKDRINAIYFEAITKNEDKIVIEFNPKSNSWCWIEGGNIGEMYYQLQGILP